MSKCNNCVKFLTCNRTECKQITYLQAGQIERPKVLKKSEITTEESYRMLQKTVYSAGISFADFMNAWKK